MSGGEGMAERIVELRNVSKFFGRICALSGISLGIETGEVVGLIGDNGAGKSTLIKILAGVVQPTWGEILVRGRPVTGWNAARSRNACIETVFQDRALAMQQSVVRNIFMGRELAGYFGWLKLGREMREAERFKSGSPPSCFRPARSLDSCLAESGRAWRLPEPFTMKRS
jgi:simple sugar transport system ATP-binding protein